MHHTSQSALDRALAKLAATVEAATPEVKAAVKARVKQVRHENVVCDQLDWRVIEPEHVARELACQEFNPNERDAQVEAVFTHNNATIELFTPVSVPVLALPLLMCMACTIEKPCTYESKIANTGMGCCADCEQEGWLDARPGRRERFVRNELTVVDAISRNGVIVGRA